jgi:pimeloyl-ACP methyl ester carboxylesterase
LGEGKIAFGESMKTKRLLLLGFSVLILAVLGFLGWASLARVPSPEAFGALRPDPQVNVSLDRFVTFQPAKKKPTTAFVFYPGARVDYRAYAAPLHRIAAEGYLVILLPVRLNLALLDVNAADRAIAAFPSIRHWVMGGHSLGGVAAATYASNHDVDGLVLWASYPADDSLKNSNVKVLSIYGTQDISTPELFEDKQVLLPTGSQSVVILGGNHAQFGDYGPQPGDHEATITRAEQQKQAVEATVQFLKELGQ